MGNKTCLLLKFNVNIFTTILLLFFWWESLFYHRGSLFFCLNVGNSAQTMLQTSSTLQKEKVILSSFDTGEMIAAGTVWATHPEGPWLLIRPWGEQPFWKHNTEMWCFRCVNQVMSCQCCASIKGSNMSSQKLEMFLCIPFCSRPASDVMASGKWFSKSGTRPSWPLVNVKHAHFIFSHLPFSVHTLAISTRSLLLACVCVLCLEGDGADTVYLCWELRCCGAAEVWRGLTSVMSELEEMGEARCETGDPSEFMHVCSECLHAQVCVCVFVSYRPCIQNITSIHTLAVCEMR